MGKRQRDDCNTENNSNLNFLSGADAGAYASEEEIDWYSLTQQEHDALEIDDTWEEMKKKILSTRSPA